VEGRRAAVRTTAEDVASAGEIQRAEEEIGGDTTGGGYTSVLSVLCHGGARAYEMHMGCNLAHVG